MCFFISKTKRAFYNNLETKSVTDNKLFWKVIKPSFSDKTISNENVTLVESEEIITDEKRVSEIFNEYFGNIVASLNIPKTECDSKIIEGINDTVSTAIKRCELHPSIMKINSIISADQTFYFQNVSCEEILKEIVNLDNKKASHDDDIPTKIIKANSDIISEIIYNNFNSIVIDNCIFPDHLKTANVTPIFKKDSRTDKKNYRPVSILPNLSKICERLIYNQLSKFFECNLSKLQCGFRKGFNAQDSV